MFGQNLLDLVEDPAIEKQRMRPGVGVPAPYERAGVEGTIFLNFPMLMLRARGLDVGTLG